MTVINTSDPAARTYTTGRFNLVLPEFNNRVDVRILNQAFERLDADAAGTTFDNEFTGSNRFSGQIHVSNAMWFGPGSTAWLQWAGAGAQDRINVGNSLHVNGTVSAGTFQMDNLYLPAPGGIYFRRGGDNYPFLTISTNGADRTNVDFYNLLEFRSEAGAVRVTIDPGGSLSATNFVMAYGQAYNTRWADTSVHMMLWNDGNSTVLMAGPGDTVRGVNNANSVQTFLIDGAGNFTATARVTGVDLHSTNGQIHMAGQQGFYWDSALGPRTAHGFGVGGGLAVGGAISAAGAISAGSTISTAGAISAGAHADIRGLYMPTAAVGGTPTHVLAQDGSGWANWYPKALFSGQARRWQVGFGGQADNAEGRFDVTQTGYYVVGISNVDWGFNNMSAGNIEITVGTDAGGFGLVGWQAIARAGSPWPGHGQAAAVWEGMVYAGQTIRCRITIYGAVGIHPNEFGLWGNLFVWFLQTESL